MYVTIICVTWNDMFRFNVSNKKITCGPILKYNSNKRKIGPGDVENVSA